MIGKMNVIDEIERYVKLQGLSVSKAQREELESMSQYEVLMIRDRERGLVV
ncbi:hypothetical protein GGG87_03710 [Streptococcus sp. zg-86]|uniref:Uncharacterized protein n=1 Tax=Streptococcus zhangguiae TaxID=2664091 RepID=A0A6I4R8I2_9STRE|nr:MULTISPECIES: hypothetical protein [unclassified Streptococcus]MTB64108.1 hypothetical protein [Streptococcus sp. zg-86]MTB90566.1 hypothetical protein [Streptococcus sp. zg-36]MWV56096.1 hypothetical protein [Streptococcus sp. zg-70]QTH48275.1 hypothetical protein J5M87_02810 [Streptococcus sp. zg-86]